MWGIVFRSKFFLGKKNVFFGGGAMFFGVRKLFRQKKLFRIKERFPENFVNI